MREPLPQCMLFYNAFLAYVHSRIFGKEKKEKSVSSFLPCLLLLPLRSSCMGLGERREEEPPAASTATASRRRRPKKIIETIK